MRILEKPLKALDYEEAMTRTMIGGSKDEQAEFFEKVIWGHTECFWIDGCAAPTVRDFKINFKLKPGGKPIAMQPIPLSPYDDMRVEYHLWEAMHLGKMRKVDTMRERLPEWSACRVVWSARVV